MKIQAIAPTLAQLKYWESLKGRSPWNKGTKGIMKPNSGSFKKNEHHSIATEIKKGQRLSPLTEFKKGNISWTQGQKLDYMTDEKHHSWKGDNVGYIALHSWVARKLGKPKYCVNCETTTAKRFEWANISHEYKRDLKDWARLCKPCHEFFDKKISREVVSP